MFKKKPNIKPLAPLRSSDRRKIADQIIVDFSIEVPTSQDDEGSTNDQAAQALSLGALRNSLLPENALSARFTTTAGPNLSKVSGTVYAGAHPGDEQRILWFKIEERLIPTVYTLWRHPQLVPLLHTPDFVLQKLRSGAPLMTPGLQRGPPFPTKATRNAIVAVASLEKPSVPIVIGICEIDVAALKQVQGAKGHAVRGEHWDGDELWAWSSGGKPGTHAPDEISGWDIGENDGILQEGMESLIVEDQDDDTEGGGVAVEQETKDEEKFESQSEYLEGENAEPYERAGEEDKELSTKEVDDAFWSAFLYAVQHHKSIHKSDPHQGLNFPIHQSLVISNFVLPYLPIFTPAQAASLQIKKTSWKTAKKFIKALGKQKLLKCKDRDGGECVVLDIDFDDPAVTSFVPYKLPKKDTAGAESGGGGGGKAIVAGSSSGDDSVGQRLQQLKLLRPKEQLSPIFEVENASTKALYLPAELRPIIIAYIESENLISETNKRLVKLNPILANAVFDGNGSLDREVIAIGSVPRDALMERIIQSCSPFWAILRNDETRENVKAKAGNAPKVHIVLETRSGNKTVTKLSGVEVFHINPQPLAEELQKACASSTSVNQLVGSSPKNAVQEIMVQGPQKDAVVKALEKRGVNRHWIEVLDKTKTKKKWEGRAQ
ncbi:hypothetical protein N7G274_010449 [Stereocaulon virgatum]|uniref:SUI1 domain-containing protein n=1 Tax=Stereocaulon virgatum TaxID=373712 RepID=A0ABR3ZV86_9LECA